MRSTAAGKSTASAVLVAATGLALAVIVGFAMGGAISGASLTLTRRGSVGTSVAVVVIAVAITVLLAARLLARRVVPRIAGSRYQPLAADRAWRLVAVAAVLVGAAIALAGLETPRLALAWWAGVALCGSLGGWSASRRIGPAQRRMRFSQEDGVTAAEFIGVTVVFAALIAALLVTPFASTIRDWGEHAVCTLFGGECDDPDAHDNQPLFACEQQREQRGGNANVGFVVDIERNIDYTITTFSDGTVQLMYADGTAVGAGVGVGVQADLYWGEGGLTLGGQASAGGALRFIEGEIYEWSGPGAYEKAQDFRLRHAMSDGASDVLLPSGPISDGGAAILRGAVDAADWVARKIPGVDGLQIEEPDRVLVHAEGGIELSASASGGNIMPGLPGGNNVIQNNSGSIEAAFGSAVGHTYDTSTGELVVYLTVESGIEIDVSADPAAVTASWADESVVAVRLDADRQLVDAVVTSYRLDEAGRDITASTSLFEAFPDRLFGDATASGATLAQPSLYEVQTRVDLTTDEGMAVLDNVIVGGALQGAGGIPGLVGEVALMPAHHAGTTTIVEYDTSDRRYGGDLSGGKILEVTGGASLSASDRDALAAYYYDEVTGGYAPWTRCVS